MIKEWLPWRPAGAPNTFRLIVCRGKVDAEVRFGNRDPEVIELFVEALDSLCRGKLRESIVQALAKAAGEARVEDAEGMTAYLLPRPGPVVKPSEASGRLLGDLE